MADGIVHIPLTQGYVATIDAADYARVAQHSWSAKLRPFPRTGTPYARAWVRGRQVLLHRFILGEDSAASVDHRDGDGLNCRRENLRAADASQNQANAPGRRPGQFKGVYRYHDKWKSVVSCRGKQLYLGLYDTAELAAAAYDLIARDLFGEYARLNFPKGCSWRGRPALFAS